MEQIKFNGIVLKAVDYKDKDKLLTIFTLELGILTATLKGVNQDKAKLKFAAMPFCFAEFVATSKNGFYTITECTQIESFYNIISNYNKSIAGFLGLEISSIIIQNVPDELWFITLINYLKTLEFSNCNDYVAMIKFILTTLNKIGYGLSFDCCSECGLKFVGDVYINMEMGESECATCKSANSTKLTRQQFAVLNIINNTDFASLSSIKQKDEVYISILTVLKHNLQLRLGTVLKSLK